MLVFDTVRATHSSFRFSKSMCIRLDMSLWSRGFQIQGATGEIHSLSSLKSGFFTRFFDNFHFMPKIKHTCAGKFRIRNLAFISPVRCAMKNPKTQFDFRGRVLQKTLSTFSCSILCGFSVTLWKLRKTGEFRKTTKIAAKAAKSNRFSNKLRIHVPGTHTHNTAFDEY